MISDEVLRAWLDGELDGEAEAAVFAQVAEDPVAAEAVTRAVEFEVLLGECAAMVLGPGGGIPARRSWRRRLRALPRRRLLTALLPLVVAVVVIGWLARAAQPDLPRLVSSGETVAAGTILHSADTAIELRYRDGTTLHLAPGSELAVRAGDAKTLHLERGRLRASVEPQGAGRAMMVTTPTATATVLGTVLQLAVDVAGCELRVERGRVALRRAADGREVVVASGELARDVDLRVRSAAADLITSATWRARSAGWNEDGEWIWHLAHDGSIVSEIHADSREEQWLEYAFDRPHKLDQVRVYEDDEGKYSLGRWRITAEVDGEWRELVPWRDARAAGWHQAELGGVVATAIRLHCLPPDDALLEIYEFECAGAPAAP